MTHRAVLAAAALAGTAVRITRRPFRSALRAAPGLAGAAAIAVGVGHIAGNVFGRSLTWWVALTVAGLFAIWIAADLNHVPAAPRRDDGEL